MEEDTRLKNLLVGTSVNIKRTDGRVHQALVAEVNDEVDAVTVEWIERGETKGKEVELDDLFLMNPDLLRTFQRSSEKRKFYRFDIPSPSLPPVKNVTRNDLSLRLASRPTDEPHSPTKTSPRRERSPRNDVEFRSTSYLPRPKVDKEKEKEKPKPELKSVEGESSIPKPYRREKTEGKLNVFAALVDAIGSSSVGPTVPAKQQQQQQLERSRASTSVSSKARRSNVVKEVERLKKNREQRRAKQAEEKAEKEYLMSHAPGPYWELQRMVRDYQTSTDFRPIEMNDSLEEHQITVCVRKRPLNRAELARKEVDVISVVSKNTVVVHEPKNKVDLTKYLENQFFRFDCVFDETCANELIYRFTARPLVDTIFEGAMATCFAYGQTGSGKTHTMSGDFLSGSPGTGTKNQNYHNGVYALVAKDVFAYLRSARYAHLDLTVAASFFEIYSGKVFDLLSKKARLRVLEDGKQQVQIVGLTERVVRSAEEVLGLIQVGSGARTSGQTSANANSSRSHAVFQLVLRNAAGRPHGKISLIDLAGNERGSDTSSADRSTRMEGAEINKSLLSLKECIRALGKKNQAHLPFRASKLTQILRDSFIGDKSRTCMIATISPSVTSCEHTLNTLRYADRVKELAVTSEDTPDSPDKVDRTEPADTDKDKVTEVVSELVRSEEAMVDNHKTIVDFLDDMILKSKELYARTNAVDYDQDRYSREWDDLLEAAMQMLQVGVGLVREFRDKLNKEELLNRTLLRSSAANSPSPSPSSSPSPPGTAPGRDVHF